jgi:hypothetical protein
VGRAGVIEPCTCKPGDDTETCPREDDCRIAAERPKNVWRFIMPSWLGPEDFV